MTPEVDVDPIGDIMVDYLIALDREDAFLDFKETIDLGRNNFPNSQRTYLLFQMSDQVSLS